MSESINISRYTPEEAYDEAIDMQRVIDRKKRRFGGYAYEWAARDIERITHAKSLALEVPTDMESYQQRQVAHDRMYSFAHDDQSWNNPDYVESKDEWVRLGAENNERSKVLVENWLEDVYQGKHGAGVLALSCHSFAEPELVRALPLYYPWVGPHLLGAREESLVENVDRLHDTGVCDSAIAPHARMPKWPLETATFNNTMEYQRYARVELSYNEQELDDLASTLVGGGYVLGQIARAFPEDYKLKVLPGQEYYFGSCEHHTGEVDGKQLILPNDRFAVVADYYASDDDLDERTAVFGVSGDMAMMPRWSARYGSSWRGDELESPTEEERAFICEALEDSDIRWDGAASEGVEDR